MEHYCALYHNKHSPDSGVRVHGGKAECWHGRISLERAVARFIMIDLFMKATYFAGNALAPSLTPGGAKLKGIHYLPSIPHHVTVTPDNSVLQSIKLILGPMTSKI